MSSAREVLGQYPGRQANRWAAQCPVKVYPNPTNRHHNEHRGNDDENIVETRDEAEVLFINSGRGSTAGYMGSESRGGFRRQCTRRNRIINVTVAVHRRKLIRSFSSGNRNTRRGDAGAGRVRTHL